MTQKTVAQRLDEARAKKNRKIDRLRAENERLRKALEKIVAEDVGPTDGLAQEVLMACRRIAMDALEATDDD